MSSEDKLVSLFRSFSGAEPVNITELKQSGSARKYYRVEGGGMRAVAAINNNREENDAFIGFSRAFRSANLPVPEIYLYKPEEHIYLLEDVGEKNLYEYISEKEPENRFDHNVTDIYRQSLECLVRFQTEGLSLIDTDLCYPHRSFGRQSLLWDMHYFKYMFLNLMGVRYHEDRLEKDFNSLADYLMEAPSEYFLYRDFQSANIMIRDGEPWFIDYQGGRRGALQYDPASLLCDAKAGIPASLRATLLLHYTDCLTAENRYDRQLFLDLYTDFAIIRLMQALGTFGFRGLYERKPTFTESIVPGVELIISMISESSMVKSLGELTAAISRVPATERYNRLGNR